ncbi:Chromatin structure-remodeling complex protein rsc9 [Vermiconidia calcicola]|uniref:Chromatin structure-remodeling complex protein rsc9 n=1 Tax=Vermiconidia calcicola TaxID=1690605 RepID=A0ACC3N1Y3_9PEZI|nr:Chromatin structure-remodeling complex protein rsc9 [Vermiconidia calcicola]
MPPKRGESIERTDEREEFVGKVAEYHEKRGTNFDPEPKVGIRHIDILKLYKRVVDEGGYDLVSDTKAKPLMWRRLAEEFIGKNQYTPAQAFQLKNVYYKNLCAYEISTHWGKEPPPKEILEEVTAKGANVMTRTLENFARPVGREQVSLGDGEGSEANASPEAKTATTPKEEKMEEDPGSGAGRTRGLRQQPPQRALFQPDLTASRQKRGALQQGMHGSPVLTPGGTANGIMNASTLTNGAASSTLASYEPQQSYPLSLKPVITPANNPDFYRNERKRKLEASAGPLAKKYKNIMLPGTGFIGPNIYVRAQMALQSGIPDEEQYALHHLVKISHERGDKYRFDQFPGLAEALVKKVVQVSSLFYDVDWDVTYGDDYSQGADEEVLNGLYGTSDVIQKLRSRIPRITDDNMHETAFASHLNRITEAGLILRNMCMLEENARYLSSHPLIRDYLSIVLDLPQHAQIVELRHYALETAEQVLKYCDIGADDALYHSLLDQLDREDRGAITIALRTISRIAMNLPPPKRLEDVSDEILQRVQDWLMVEDEELRSACLDFLMQYTSFADNVDNLLQALDAEALARQLSRLLFFAAKEHKDAVRPTTRQQDGNNNSDPPAPVPRLSRGIVEQLLHLSEPDRSSEWLRMCFASDPTAELTQISLWQAYQATFGQFHTTHQHLIAGEFIKNVSNTFAGATAQVAGNNKYVIRGIRARKVPVESGVLGSGLTRVSAMAPTEKRERELRKCCWQVQMRLEGQRDPITGFYGPPTTREHECGEWFRHGEDVLRHILATHLQLPSKRLDSAVNGHEEAEGVDKMEIDSKDPLPPRPTSAVSSTSGVGGLTNETAPTITLAKTFDFQAAGQISYYCRWSDCPRSTHDFDDSKAPRAVLLTRHIQTHLPGITTGDGTSKHNNLKPNAKKTNQTPAETIYFTTLQDEKGDAAGVPLGAALVLRNIAKFFPPPQSSASTNGVGAKSADKDDGQAGDGILEVFDEEVRERLFLAMALNRTVKDYVGTVLRAVRAAEERVA